MFKVIDIVKHNSILYGVTKDGTKIEFKHGDKFKYYNHKYRVGFEGNYFAYIPWWEYISILHKLANLIVGKRDYNY